jgi:hypothetical protein
LRVQATNRAPSFEVTIDGTGVVGHAGAALLRELADHLELTTVLGWRPPGGRHRRHPDGAVLPDVAVMLAAGGDPDVELLVVDADATLVTAHSNSVLFLPSRQSAQLVQIWRSSRTAPHFVEVGRSWRSRTRPPVFNTAAR